MDSLYGINVKNKFELFIDEDVDPLEILAQQESAKKEQDKKKKDDKTKKNKNAKKSVLKTENKNKPVEEIKPVKEEKVNAPRQQSERPRTGRQNRDNREDNRPPRRRDENFNPENRDRSDRPSGGFSTERSEGGGFGGQRGEGGFNRGRGRGGRMGRGAGRGDRGGRGGFGGKREFERHSGSDRTGVKATEKREGSGSHNWGTVKDDIDLPPKVDYWRDPKEQMKDVTEEPQEWTPQAEDTENKDPNESTESAPAEEPEDEGPKQLTLEEWKKMEDAKRMKSQFKLRKANEGVDTSQWKSARVYRKSEGDEESEEEESEEEEEDEDEMRQKKLVNEIRITFNDSPRRGRGGRRPRGARGGRSGGGRGDRRSANAAPKFDDENDFPSLIKSAA
ncbi:SERPINE1 mRNA-binding protein 1-like isoform X2 [Ruditapes philippinarum]|uniref:SERPINE1 mRNA-binding protein 1-like isoform X2 n=1 Tax=Ruditapes philippinarum TaxID=129788 RepID=UPI00295B2130|nr:SERPINE1 mRNA-binding protein 1-like isoform X2 [Ruditapes philippinarum]